MELLLRTSGRRDEHDPGPTPSEVRADLPASGEAVIRPEGSLARGRYEAPSWVFVAVAVTALLALACSAGRAAWGLRKGGPGRTQRSSPGGGRTKA